MNKSLSRQAFVSKFIVIATFALSASFCFWACGDKHPQVELGPKSKDAIEVGQKKGEIEKAIELGVRGEEIHRVLKNLDYNGRLTKIIKDAKDTKKNAEWPKVDFYDGTYIISAPYISSDMLRT